ALRWHSTGPRTAVVDVELGKTVKVGIARLDEDIAHGQCIARYTILGAVNERWRPLARGKTIGYRKLERFEPTPVRRVRVVVEDAVARSEEHTSELQSRGHLVCRLLLKKKQGPTRSASVLSPARM